MKRSKLIILGSGPAGCTAAIYAARANLDPILITETPPGGKLLNTNRIENWPGEERAVTGEQLMQRMLLHARRFRARVAYDRIVRVDLSVRPFALYGNEHRYSCHSLIVATGSSTRYLEIPSEAQFIGRGVSTCAVCDGFFYRGKNVAVVGGGNTAVEEALYLSNIAKIVHVIHRNDTFRAEKILVDQMVKKTHNGNVCLHTSCRVTEILGSKTGMTSVRVQNSAQNVQQDIAVDGLFVAIGQNPNTSLFTHQLRTKNGYIAVVDSDHSKTSASVRGVFAAGDVTDSIYRQAITSSGMGCMAALDAKSYLNSMDYEDEFQLTQA